VPSRNCEKLLLASSCLSVCQSDSPNGTTRLPLDRFSWNLIFVHFLENVSRKRTLREDLCTFMTISRRIIFKPEHVLRSITFFSENRVFYKIMWKSVLQLDKPLTTTGRMRFACWITKATNTRTEYITLIAFPQLQWLRERAYVTLHAHCLCRLIHWLVACDFSLFSLNRFLLCLL
jgi:hypothetical protein